MIRLSLTHRMARVWLAIALVAGVSAYGFTGSAPSAEAAQSGTSLSLTTMSPTEANSSSQTVNLGGQLKVASGQTYGDVIVQLDIIAIQNRSEMSQGPESSADETQLSSVQDHLGDVSGTTAWSLNPTVAQMGLTPGTVYALDVQAWSGGLVLLGSVRTYLPYKITSGSSFTATQLAVLVPVTAASPLDGYQYQPKDNGSPWDEATSNELVSQMGATGSLSTLLTQGEALKGVDLSWAVDPDLLDTASAIQSGYFVAAGEGADDQAGSGAANASAWLKLADSVLGKNGELWQLPSTDPDLGSLSNLSSAQGEQFVNVSAAQTAKSTTLAASTQRKPLGLLAWPADGQVDTSALALSQSLNPTAVVTASNSVNLTADGGRYTPTGRASINGKNNITVADSDLDAIMSGDAADAGYVTAGSDSTLLAKQRLMAQTALIAREEPDLSGSRTVLITLPRSSAESSADMSVLSALGQADWVRASGFSTLVGARPDPKSSTGHLTRSAAVVKTDLTTAQLDQAVSLSSQFSLFQSILVGGDSSDGLSLAVERTVSTDWRGQPGAWGTFAAAVQRRLTGQMGQVYLIQKSDITLSGTSGSIPFTVHNGLNQRVRLGLNFSMKPTGRLDISSVAAAEIPAHSSRTIQVRVTSRSPSATIQVTAYLVNPAGAHYGGAEGDGSQTLQVSVTSIGFVALLLFAGSAALLVIAVGLRIYRGRRGSRKKPGTREGD
ncbi:DUF6049 family protein [Actinospica robiniae]|uniref:DUF6049 family protein n=1 Tax=Actinospica robiniae TaxID=304901 RepID=UPI00040425BB|nr:DUF6049 family protein [Actinospica robiniae]